MDFSNIDPVAASEAGTFVHLVHPFTRKPLGEGEDKVGFLVRGVAAPSVQSRLLDLSRQDEEQVDADNKLMLSRLHERWVEGALPYIIRAEGIEMGGRPVSSEQQYREVLLKSFPDFEVGDDGKLSTRNYPFARQIIDVAEDGSHFFGEISPA